MLCNIRKILFLSLVSSTLYAGTVVDIKNKNGQTTQFQSTETRGRLNSANEGSYVVIDYPQQKILIVMPDQKQILLIDGTAPLFDNASTKETVNSEVRKVGDGPDVAGYSTREYQILAGGEVCSTVFGSEDAMTATGMRQMFDALQKVASQSTRMMKQFKPDSSPCDQAKAEIVTHIGQIGAPLRSLDAQGNPDVEITRIQTDVDLPAETFSVPAEYPVVSISDKVKQAREQIQKQIPKMEQMIRQMEAGGTVDPASIEKMKKMMQQYKSAQ